MTSVPAFRSVVEATRQETQRVYHDDSACPSGKEIPATDRRGGRSDYRRCEICAKLGRTSLRQPTLGIGRASGG
jgi:hypothetical protein